jgi:chromosome segregation ATPase
MSEAKDMVTFTNIQRSYPPGEEMAVRYVIDAGSELKTSKRDWVGLFRVGWTSSRDYYTFEWAPQPDAETREGSVKFAGRRLPPEDGHFYQLCFVSRDGAVRGASAPFQFAPLSVSLEDMELVEVSDDSMKSVMVLQKKSKEMESLRRESEEARTELSDVQELQAAAKFENEALSNANAGLREQVEATSSATKTELAALKAKSEEAESEIERLTGELVDEKSKSAEKDARVLELERQVAVKSEAQQRLSDQLGREQERNRELLTVKEGEEQELKVLKGRVSAVEGELVVATSEAEELRQQLRIKESQVDDLGRLVGTRGEELEQAVEKLETAEAESARLNVMCAELQASVQQAQEEGLQLQGSLQVDINAALCQKDQHIEKLEQELACMQANIAELMGAQRSNKTTEQPQHTQPLPANVVDKAAYVALQGAYETFEQYYADEKAARERVLVQLKASQEECVRLQAAHKEMVQRVKQCEAEYKSKAQECAELRRQLKKEGLPTKVAGKPQPMEQEHEEMVRNCQTAAEELSLHRKECNEKGNEISALQAEVAKAKRRYQELEDRFDKKVSEKNDEIERQRHVFAEKADELAVIMTERDELRAKVAQVSRSVKKPADASSRSCPVCDMKFPMRMTGDDFEKHVQGHFNDTV